MAEADVIRALHNKQEELTTGINRLEQQIVEHRAGLAHLDQVMRLFDPSIQPEAVHSGRRAAERMWSRPGELLRLIYDVLREAPHPMATRYMIPQNGPNSKMKSYQRSGSLKGRPHGQWTSTGSPR